MHHLNVGDPAPAFQALDQMRRGTLSVDQILHMLHDFGQPAFDRKGECVSQ